MDGLHTTHGVLFQMAGYVYQSFTRNFAMFSFDQVSVLTEDTIHITSPIFICRKLSQQRFHNHSGIKPESAPSNDIMVKMQPLHQTLVCLFNDADAYQWGYDSIPEITDHELVGQNFSPVHLVIHLTHKIFIIGFV